MTRIIFYVNVPNRGEFLHKFLRRKVFIAHKTALIYAAAAALPELDSMLWEKGFLPHQIFTADVAAEAPIMLTAEAPPPEYTCDMLISLGSEVPAFAGSFPVLVDVVGSGDETKKAGRQRYSYFKDHGYSIEVMDMAKS